MQLRTRTKLFCGCPNEFGGEPNSRTCPVCLGMPGALPVLNESAVELAVRAARALGCEVNERSRFARKNYFYPDLPKGYQISQYDQPIAGRGVFAFDCGGERREVRILRAHLEEDAGKSIHDGMPRSGTASYVDLNRCGVPLLEIVSEPDLRSPEEADAFLATLRSTLLYAAVTDANMDEGSLRCDANISLRPHGQESLNPKTELKNLNSFRFMRQALRFEVERQAAALEAGEELTQSTRLFDEHTGETASMRAKEEAHDYRYFPEPDLVPVVVDEARIAAAVEAIPELPLARLDRFVAEHGISPGDAAVLVESAIARLLRGADRRRRAAGRGQQLGTQRGRTLAQRARRRARRFSGRRRGARRIARCAGAGHRGGGRGRQGNGQDGRDGSVRGGYHRRGRSPADLHQRRAGAGHRRGHRGASRGGRGLPRWARTSVRILDGAGDAGHRGNANPDTVRELLRSRLEP